MADNTVTLVLDGRVPLAEFAKGVVAFNELVSALSTEMSGGEVSWVLDDLQFSSAVATARAEGSAEQIGRIVHAYADVGASLESKRPIQYGETVRDAVRKIVDIGVERVRFETADRESLVIPAQGMLEIVPPPSTVLQMVIRPHKPSFGSIKGRIQTLTSRGGLRFTVYDTYYDKAVSCYLGAGQESIISEMWGQLASVEGWITRDPVNGRPIAVRQVAKITPLRESAGKLDYQKARGASPSRFGLSAVDAIRKVRDAE